MKLKKHQIVITLGIVVSVVLLWVSLRHTNFEQILLAFQNVDLVYAIPFLLALFLYYWLKAYRWHLLLKPVKQTETTLVYPPMMIGYAGSLILPLQLGELIRVYLVSKLLQVRQAPVLTSVVLERLFDFLTLLLLVSASSFFIDSDSKELQNALYIVGLLCLLLFVFVGIYIFFTRSFLAFIKKLSRVLPDKIHKPLIENLEAGANGLSTFKSVKSVLSIGFLSLVQWLFMLVCVYISLLAANIPVSPVVAFLVLTFVIIGISIPTSPGFIGSIQAAYYFALAPYGISANDAFTASVFYHLLAYVSVLLVGAYYLKKFGLTFSKLKQNADYST